MSFRVRFPSPNRFDIFICEQGVLVDGASSYAFCHVNPLKVALLDACASQRERHGNGGQSRSYTVAERGANSPVLWAQ